MEAFKTINALKARQNLGNMLEGVYYKGDKYVIERAGKPMAAVIPVWQLRDWQKRRERFFAKIDGLWEKNKKASPGIIEQEVAEAVQAIRARPVPRAR